MGAVRGKDFKLYRNTDQPYDNTPTWSEVTNVRDLKRNLEKALADASTRGSKFRQQIGTLKELSIDFQMVYDETDTHYAAFEAAFFTDTDVELLVLDGPIETVGSKGVRFLAQVSKFGTDESLEEVGKTDVTVVPSYSPLDPPRQVQVTSPGAVVDV